MTARQQKLQRHIEATDTHALFPTKQILDLRQNAFSNAADSHQQPYGQISSVLHSSVAMTAIGGLGRSIYRPCPANNSTGRKRRPDDCRASFHGTHYRSSALVPPVGVGSSCGRRETRGGRCRDSSSPRSELPSSGLGVEGAPWSLIFDLRERETEWLDGNQVISPIINPPHH
jgi:hypothetical protein